MNIQGFNKLTLLDYPGLTACTVFTGGCDLRCPFCHNSPLVTRLSESPVLTEEEVLDFLSARKGFLDGVVLSGGEPLLQPGAADFLEKVRSLGCAVKLDTNGCYPAVLADILNRGLVDYVAMDIKNCPARYAETCGLQKVDLAAIEESARFLMGGKVDFEFRTTVVRELHTPQDMVALGQWLTELSGGKPVQKLFLQPFVDRDTVVFSGLGAPESSQMAAFTELLQDFVLDVSVRG
jgi:pyruvate formate lyase activating enzyme